MTGARPDRQVLAKWLRSQREARGWSRPRMARLLIDVAHARGDTQIPDLESMCHNIYRWERGASGLSDQYRLLCCHVFAIPPGDFGHAGTPGAELPAYVSADTHGTAIAAIVVVWADGSTTTMRCQ